MSASVRNKISEVYENESRRVLATLIRLLGDIDVAEEALQEAFQAALESWEDTGIPANPRAWLVSAGRHKGIDAIRRQRRGAALAQQQALEDQRGVAAADEWDGVVIKDDQLRLVFTCCHPALPIDARVALSLRIVCGLTTEEIARAFLVPVETMKKRITRAKATLRDDRIPYEVPPQSEMPARLAAVLHVIYLVYNEGYSATSGDRHLRRDLSARAITMARLVVELLPEAEATGLLALMLLHESRSKARMDAGGDLVPLEAQDRDLWDRELIAEGTDLVRRSVMSGRFGSYVIQAAIASVHASADSVENTRWDVIVGYYDMLAQLQESPVVALNRAIAVGMRDGPAAGLAIIQELLATPALASYHLAHAAHADFCRRAGRFADARASYERAIELARQEPERRYLRRCLEEISD